MNKMINPLILFTIATLAYAQMPSKIDVSVYYESLCPDSIAFVTKQLSPTWMKLNKYLSVTLVPFGLSNQTKNPDIQFSCHHGPNECLGNKVHACAIDVLTSEDERVKMVNCLMSKTQAKQEKPLEYMKCAEDLKLDVAPLKDCVNNQTRSDELLYKFGEKTKSLQPPLKSVPTVVFKSQYREDIQNKATKDLTKTVCEELGGPTKVKECANGGFSQKPVLGLVGLSMLVAFVMGKM